MKSFILEFREFASKGNVVDLAVGIIIGVAFAKIVDSVVNDLITPILAGALGKADFSGLFIPARQSTGRAAHPGGLSRRRAFQ